jgi:uncharacterized protein (TIGR00369 family)
MPLTVDGLTFLQGVRDGRHPADPFTEAFGFRLAEVERGALLVTGTVDERAISASGFAHGGWLSALMDLATGMVVHSPRPAGSYSPHLQASYRFVRPATAGSVVRCRAEVVSLGKSFGTARCELRDDRDRLIATGESTNAIAQVRDAPEGTG